MVECVPITDYLHEGIVDLLVYPNICWPYFYLLILIGLWIILAVAMYSSELKRFFTAEMLSSVSISGIAVTILALIGTLIIGSEGIPMVNSRTLMTILSLTIISIVVWIFKD